MTAHPPDFPNLTNRRNSFGVKDSSDRYRHIKGVLFVGWTADTTQYAQERREAKALGLRTRIIDGELFREVREVSRRPFRNALCQAHLPRPGFQWGSRACACLRRANHTGPHRACGRWEWAGDDPRTCYDIKERKEIAL